MEKRDDKRIDEITPKRVYLNRRLFMRGAVLAATVSSTGLLYRWLNPPPAEAPKGVGLNNVNKYSSKDLGIDASEQLTSIKDVTNYNNFYEFSTDKESVAPEAKEFTTRPWSVSVEGLANKPRVFDIEEILAFPQEERIYRLRCVEGWSMVIPWVGFSLSKLLEQVEPKPEARYLAFQTLYDPRRMPNQRTGVLDWPYVEGLRIDEAMHPLTILATGMYDQLLPPQDGAPLRLVVPWKYGFKSIKSIVKISLIDSEPPTTWSAYAPGEYGFYSNVNPNVPHPRWSQSTERRIGEYTRRKTLPFNGYSDQVAHLYSGMDLRKYF